MSTFQSKVDHKVSQLGGASTGTEEERTGGVEPSPALGATFLPQNSNERLYPNDMARLIMRDHRIIKDGSDILYEYNQRYWERIPDSLLLSYAQKYDSHQYTKRSRRAEAANYVIDSVLLPEIPWRSLKPTEVPCWSGVVDVVEATIRPHRAEDYLEAVVPHVYDPQARCPVWLRSLDRWFQGETDADTKIAAIQEFFGYCLLPHARYKKALFLLGEGDTGKSLVGQILTQLVGPRNYCTLSTEQMDDERKRAPIVGKMLNMLSELPAEAMIKDGGFKQLVSTGDPISIDPKYKDPFSYVPFCKHVIIGNLLPQISDLSRATFNRLLLVKFNHILSKSEQDKGLQDKLSAEMVGIYAWAVEGADRLVKQNGEFTVIEESATAIQEYRDEQNPVVGFIEAKCRAEENAKISRDEFRDRFLAWLGRGANYSPNKVTRMLRSAGYKVQVSDGSIRYAMGLEWRQAVGDWLQG